MALVTSSGNNQGSQGSTQSPQTSAGPSSTATTPAARGGAVQPGTAKDLLTSSNGILLGAGSLSTVPLNGSTSGGQTSVQQSETATSAHHVNTSLLGFSLGLFLIAVALFWFMRNAEKNTTE